MFITKEDLQSSIRINRLEQIIDSDQNDDGSATLEAAINTAESKVNDKLFKHYDTETIFSQVGDARSSTVIQWLRYLTIYYLYERIPDEQVPERVIKNYNDVIDELDKIAEGRQQVALPRRPDVNGQPTTKFKWGSVPKRSH